jgi:signal transduction histidine kinase
VGIGTVIQLLVDNALKFSDGVVTVAAEKNGNEVVFEIRDSGIGIPDSQLERIFELFYQIESSTTRKYGGTGIGLALAKLILENHQTEIHVRSKVGKGTVFTFSLPMFSW